MDVDEAFDLISRAIDSGRAANGYLIVGDMKGAGEPLAERVLEKLFPEEVEQVRSHSHPDIAYLLPEGAKRIIKVDSMRERIVEPMALESFSGGWKAGVIFGADRMEAPSANAFLKSLEEPTKRTIYLLLTDQSDAILPTIVSRTQRIDLPLSDDVLTGSDYEAVSEAFGNRDAASLAAIFAEMKESVEDEEVQLVRKRFFRTLVGFVRQLALGGKVPRYQAFRNVDAVEDAYRQSNLSMSDEAVFSFMLDRITFP